MPRWCRCKALGSDPEKFCQTMPRNFVAQKLPAAIALLGSLHDAFDLSWRDDSVVCFFGVEARKMPNFNIDWKQCSWFFSTKWGSKASCAGFSRLQNCSKKVMRSFSTYLNFLKHPVRSQTHCSLSKMALTLEGSDPFSECLGALFKKGSTNNAPIMQKPMNATNQTIDSDSFQIELLHSDNRIGIHLSIGAVIVRPFSRKFNFFFETQWCQPSPFEVSKFGQGKRNHSETDSCPWRFILPRSQRSYEALAISMVHPWRRWSCHSLLGNNTIISIIIFQKWPNKTLPVRHSNHSWLW